MTSEPADRRWNEPAAGGPVSEPATDAEPTTEPIAEPTTGTDPGRSDPSSSSDPSRDEEPTMQTQTDPTGAGADAPPSGPSGSGQDGPPPSGPDAPGAEFFGRIRAFGVVRPDHDRWLSGVCVALARRWNIDPILARGVAVVLLILGPGILLYGLAWAFLPKADGRIHAQQVLTGDVSAGFVGAAALVAGWLLFPALRFGHDGFGWGGPVLVGGALIALAIWWYVRKQEGKPLWPSGGDCGLGTGPAPQTGAGPWYGPGQRPATSPDAGSVTKRIETSAGQWGAEFGAASKRMGDAAGTWATEVSRSWQQQRRVDPSAPSTAVSRITVGLALLAGASAVVLDRAFDLPGSTWLLGLSGALVMVAVGIIAAGVLGRRPGGLAPLGVLLAVGLLASFAVGNRTWQPADDAQSRQDYQLIAGEAVLDLDRLPGTGADLKATVGVGELTVTVPRGTAAEIRIAIGAGTLRSGTSRDEARSIRQAEDQHRTVLVIGDPDRAAENVVEAQVGLGDITVISADPAVSDR